MPKARSCEHQGPQRETGERAGQARSDGNKLQVRDLENALSWTLIQKSNSDLDDQVCVGGPAQLEKFFHHHRHLSSGSQRAQQARDGLGPEEAGKGEFKREVSGCHLVSYFNKENNKYAFSLQ